MKNNATALRGIQTLALNQMIGDAQAALDCRNLKGDNCADRHEARAFAFAVVLKVCATADISVTEVRYNIKGMRMECLDSVRYWQTRKNRVNGVAHRCAEYLEDYHLNMAEAYHSILQGIPELHELDQAEQSQMQDVNRQRQQIAELNGKAVV